MPIPPLLKLKYFVTDPIHTKPRVSVVVPVFNGGTGLEKCLSAIIASSYPVFECIVVDDGSTDGMAKSTADQLGAHLIRLEEQCGPARARNQGAARAKGDILLFADADVMLHPNAIERAVSALQSDPDISAVFGSYDDQPCHSSFVSQYRNLLHHWVHQTSSEEASTFWTGCGAIYRDIFIKMGGFRESFERPSIEDIELGVRLRNSGYRIRLEKTILATHMKHWSIQDVIRTDIFQRGVPWMLLLLSSRHLHNDLNLGYKARIATALAGLLGLLLAVLPFIGHTAALMPAAAFLLGASASAWFSSSSGRSSMTIPIALAVLPPLLCYTLAPDAVALFPLILILAIVLTHQGFYRYVAAKRNIAFAIGVVPMHLVFFLCCAASIPIALTKHYSDAS
jgi:glycosyltransferase involved in cell wall biosynthesis